MQIQASGIVLKTIPYSDQSKIVRIFSREAGVHAYLIRFPKKNTGLHSLYQPGMILDLILKHKPSQGLHYVEQVRLKHTLISIQRNMLKSNLMMFYLDVLLHILQSETADAAVYDFTESTWLNLDAEDGIHWYMPCKFLIELSELMGFSPNPQYGEQGFFDLKEGAFLIQPPDHPFFLNLEVSRILSKLLRSTPEEVPSVETRRALLDGLISYYQWHIPNFPEMKSLAVLREIWS